LATNNDLSFPDIPRGNLDAALDELVLQARTVLETQSRLRALLRANQAVVSQLELPVVLRRIAQSAVELVGAEYGALGVISPVGGLEEFIHVGMPDAVADSIGHLPEGHGLLGALIDDPQAIRLPHLAADPRSAGFPAHHPPMESFLGVPIRVRDEVFGNLYLTNGESGEFSAEDEQLVQSLAASAGFAIANARLYSETERRRAWAAASAEVTAAMLSANHEDAIEILVDRVLELSGSDIVAIVTDAGADLRVSIAVGLDAAALSGMHVAKADSVSGSVLEAGQPLLLDNGFGDLAPLTNGRRLGPVMAVPLFAGGVPDGVLIVGRLRDRVRFTRSDLEMAADFAGQASVALELLRAKALQQSVLLAEDRSRIARDLHDHVIQQLFGSGLELQSVASSLASPALTERLMETVGHLDDAIAQIRTVIFALTPPRASTREGIRHRLIELANELARALPRMPSVSFSGPVDLAVQGDVAEDVLAVAREGLTNAAKYARAQGTGIALTVTEDAIVLEITDDGIGIRSDRRSGLANLERRATRRGGDFTVTTSESGTGLTWAVPIAQEEA
jgi:signal transduction histidine kinase